MFRAAVRFEDEPWQVLPQDSGLLLAVAVVYTEFALLAAGQCPIPHDQAGGAGPREHRLAHEIHLKLTACPLQLLQEFAAILCKCGKTRR